MHDVLGVHEVEGEQHLVNDASCALLREAVALLTHDLLHQVPAAHQLCHDVIIAGVLHQVKDTSDVRVLGLLEHLELVLVEFFVDLVLTQLLLTDYLDSAGHL